MAKIKDRIAQHSQEHWVLFSLSRYEEHKEVGVTESELYEATGEKLPSVEWVREGLEELFRRNLADLIEGEYRISKTGSSCLSANGKPEKTPWTNPSPPKLDDDHTLPEEDSEEDSEEDEVDVVEMPGVIPDKPWVESEFERIYGGNDSDIGVTYSGAGKHAGIRTAKKIREKLPDSYEIVIQVGPYRMHDIAYALNTEEEVVLLDLYSVRPNESKWSDALVHDVHAEVLESIKWKGDNDGVQDK